MLGTAKSRGYLLEMVCADFLAGANIQENKSQVLFDGEELEGTEPFVAE